MKKFSDPLFWNSNRKVIFSNSILWSICNCALKTFCLFNNYLIFSVFNTIFYSNNTIFSSKQFVGLIISIPYHGHFDELDQRDIQNVQGLLYLTITETIFLFIYAVFITFPSEVPILLRETASGLYSPLPYYLSKMIFWVSYCNLQCPFPVSLTSPSQR